MGQVGRGGTQLCADNGESGGSSRVGGCEMSGVQGGSQLEGGAVWNEGDLLRPWGGVTRWRPGRSCPGCPLTNQSPPPLSQASSAPGCEFVRRTLTPGRPVNEKSSTLPGPPPECLPCAGTLGSLKVVATLWGSSGVGLSYYACHRVHGGCGEGLR